MTITICQYCGGTGKVTYDVGSHNSEYETSICPTCNGSGRMIQETRVSYEPFIPGETSERKF